MLTFFDKAIASFVTPAIIAAIGSATAVFGVSGTMDLQTVLTMILTGIITYAVPGIGKTISGFVTPAIVAAILPLFTWACAACTGTMNWKTAVTMIATGLVTHVVQNKPRSA